MGTAAISHLRYDLNKYALSLRKTATLASTFFIESPLVRFEYLQEIENTINDITLKEIMINISLLIFSKNMV
ncbi:hypothetical protein EC991775_3959 [Escherichia coli 99.1775]|nr:hypothetical protein EC991775_3959 [Escherichia coli 99.1775]